MWVRKTAGEIANTERRKRRARFNPVWPAILAAGLAFIEWLVRRGTSSAIDFTSNADVIFFLCVFALLYLTRVIFGESFLIRRAPLSGPHEEPMICAVCKTPQINTASHRCSCDGVLEPMKHWRWLDADATPAPNEAMQRTAPRADA